ncbi:MAG: hypothetical protein AAF681_12825 [Pseudomonadota bacterium]
MSILRVLIVAIAFVGGGMCQAQSQQDLTRVLWVNVSVPDRKYTVEHRRLMADYLSAYQGGTVFDVDFVSSRSGGAIARGLSTRQYDILVLDALANRMTVGNEDVEAVKAFYASGRNALMLDGSFWMRSIDHNPTTIFPGKNKGTGGLLVNQVKALADAGGGILIGTDHKQYQKTANSVLRGLIPDAHFSGITSPSTDGSFKGRVLLAHAEPVRAIDILEHWQSKPDQGEAPVGPFTDFTGRPVTLFNLVASADQPGGGERRPYISASFDPGDEEFALTTVTVPDLLEAPKLTKNMPTRKSGPIKVE